MCTMCHFCGEELTKLDQNKKNQESIELDGRAQNFSCRFCGEAQDQDLTKQASLSPSSTPMITPTTSLSSTDSSVSSCSEFSIDVNSYDRGNQDNIMYVKDPNYKVNASLQDPCSEASADAIGWSDSLASHKFREGISGSFKGPPTNSGAIQSKNGHEVVDNTTVDNKIGYVKESSFDKMEEIMWDPPEPEDPENDLENSVAYNDDDDECGDGTKWGKPISLITPQDEGSGSYKYKEEKQRETEEVINGKFRRLVCRLLGSMGIGSSLEDGESWEDVVTSLSWKAASLLKPKAIDGKAMGPDGIVKIKCIATGTRSQSQVIRGLVFKKRAAHKHMPTYYKNPKLLLLQGVLGQSSSGLSSFESMEQEERDHLNSIIEKIEMCQPNVILVEKTVSRDAQESILKKGMTLVFDMKMHRLERIARYTDSSIVSTETLTVQKLKQCESFRIEKFVEEHAGLGEGGKKPSKTLMFIEGCPTKLGCTILLKGSHSDELKKIKSVVQYSVIMAYHFILETAFLVDQRVMFSTIPFSGIASTLQNDQLLHASRSTNSIHEECTADDECCTVDIPISNGTDDTVSHDVKLALDGNSPMSYEPYNPIVFSGFSSLSASLRKVIDTSYPSLSSYLGFSAKEPNGHLGDSASILAESEADPKDETETSERQTKLSPTSSEAFPDARENGHANQMENQKKSNGNFKTVLDSQSILVLMSRRNALRGTVCEQSHFSRITFYRNFDIPLGKFLQDNILNQRTQCTTCGELPEAHFYYYAHHSKQLTIQVRRLSFEKRLPGEGQGKLWMWSCCSKCTPVNGVPRSTKRVLISTTARAMSFGKFLELSFSQYTSSTRLSNCGHSLQKDFLYFFGMGPLVAMFRYAPVTTYSISMPPQKLDFSNSIKSEWIQKEIENVYAKGIFLFKEVSNSLKRLGCQAVGSSLHHQGLPKQFSDIENMLRQESCDFELSIQNIVKNVNSGQGVYVPLNLNQALWNLLLEAFIWDKRLHSLVYPEKKPVSTATTGKATQGQLESDLGDAFGGGNNVRESEMMLPGDVSGGRHVVVDLATDELPAKEIPVEDPLQESHDFPGEEIPIDGLVIEVGSDGASSNVMEGTSRPTDGSQSAKDSLDWGPNLQPDTDSHGNTVNLKGSPLPNHLQMDRSVECTEDSDSNSDPKAITSPLVISTDSLLSGSCNSNGWFWKPFPEIRKMYLNDLRNGRVPRFEFSSANSEYFATLQHMISEESSRIHIPLEKDNYLVSDYEGELSSLIACALALLKDQPIVSIDDSHPNGGTTTTKSAEIMQNLIRVPSMSSTNWPSSGSLDSLAHSPQSIFSMDSRLSSFDGLMSLDSLFPSENFKAEVSLGVTKSLPKGKYSVVCLYADQFRDLRNWCCPSEVYFIASLSRCRNWDAKGGKSKSFFAKTLDDRFIIKEIKRTEFDSFDKFAPHYFKYMKQSFESGNQTCLAKVLGIYQVTIRQSKSGREARHDLMVMENLTFGHSIMRQYDLKGALHARFNSATDVAGDVLLDQNFVDDMNSSPLYVSNKAKHLLQRAVWNDTSFLNSINVMDYSLLVGVDVQQKELVCGIIDYLRQYTWDKQLETWVKSSLYVPRNVLPTVISPKEYKKRLRKFMSAHFLCIPDNWCLQDSPDSCELCGDESSCKLSSPK